MATLTLKAAEILSGQAAIPNMGPGDEVVVSQDSGPNVGIRFVSESANTTVAGEIISAVARTMTESSQPAPDAWSWDDVEAEARAERARTAFPFCVFAAAVATVVGLEFEINPLIGFSMGFLGAAVVSATIFAAAARAKP